MKMAGEIEELDLVVGGHSHTFLYTGRQALIPFSTKVDKLSYLPLHR